jgi:hypothetical protein
MTVRIKRENPNKNTPQKKDLTKDLARECIRLGLMFNGMQQRINPQSPIALFTDKKTRTTFSVEPGQSIKSKLTETREKFRSHKDSK